MCVYIYIYIYKYVIFYSFISICSLISLLDLLHRRRGILGTGLLARLDLEERQSKGKRAQRTIITHTASSRPNSSRGLIGGAIRRRFTLKADSFRKYENLDNEKLNCIM